MLIYIDILLYIILLLNLVEKTKIKKIVFYYNILNYVKRVLKLINFVIC